MWRTRQISSLAILLGFVLIAGTPEPRSVSAQGQLPDPAKGRAAPSKADTHRLFLSAAGGWKDLIDPDLLKRQIAEGRGSDRDPAEL